MPAKTKPRELVFDDIAKLTDREIQMAWREVDTKDLSMALVGAKPAVIKRSLENVSRRVETMIREEMTFLGRVPERELTKVRGRIADVLNILRESGLITWPPEKPKEKKAPLTAEYKAMKKKLAVQAKRPLSELQLGEVDDLITGMADVARTEGIMALDTIVSTAGDRFLGTGFRLAIDGTEPELALNILESYTESLLREHASKLRKVLEGVMSIQSGDNPRIVEQKVKAIY